MHQTAAVKNRLEWTISCCTSTAASLFFSSSAIWCIIFQSRIFLSPPQFARPWNGNAPDGEIQSQGPICPQWQYGLEGHLRHVAGQRYHKLLPASEFASCVMVLSEIPSFSSVAWTTVVRPSTPLFSISCPSSVVLSNCSPSSARCGSSSTLAISVVSSFYTSIPLSLQRSEVNFVQLNDQPYSTLLMLQIQITSASNTGIVIVL